MESNPYKSQDRAFDAFDQFDRFGCVMFSQQRDIYNQLAIRLEDKIVIEAGCGNGVGSALLDRSVSHLYATDVSDRNVRFAKQLYPWIEFGVWDICQPSMRRAGWVVCVEAFEHAADPEAAARNLLDAAYRELWVSTPNGAGKPRPPDNPFHVMEYTVEEMRKFFDHPRVGRFSVRHWETFEMLHADTKTDPLVYQIELTGP